jgi:4-aminobutyrate aminotransferase/(S)-3-amino-2-methylpropionate transaminase
MEEWQRRYPLVGDVRVLGAMAGLELVRARSTREPAPVETKEILDGCRDRGLMALGAGPHHNVIRTLMPLNIPDDLLHQGLDVLERELERVSERSG